MKKRLLSFALTLVLICSCVAISAVSVSADSENLIGDISKWAIGQYSSETGFVSSSTDTDKKRIYYSDMISVKPGEKYNFKIELASNLLRDDGSAISKDYHFKFSVRQYNESGEIQGNLADIHGKVGYAHKEKVNSKEVTIPDGIYTLGVGLYKATEERSFSSGQTIIDYINSGDITVSIVKVVEQTTSPTITMLDGAAMRIDGKTDGIRFDAKVNTAELNAFISSVDKITGYGMLVAPEGDEQYLNVDFAKETTETDKDLGDKKSVVAKYDIDNDEKPGTSGENTIIIGSLVQIDEKNVTKNYVARAYIEYTTDGVTKEYIYSNISAARSLAEVAYYLMNDKEIQTDTNKTYFASLCESHQKYVETLADKYNPTNA